MTTPSACLPANLRDELRVLDVRCSSRKSSQRAVGKCNRPITAPPQFFSVMPFLDVRQADLAVINLERPGCASTATCVLAMGLYCRNGLPAIVLPPDSRLPCRWLPSMVVFEVQMACSAGGHELGAKVTIGRLSFQQHSCQWTYMMHGGGGVPLPCYSYIREAFRELTALALKKKKKNEKKESRSPMLVYTTLRIDISPPLHATRAANGSPRERTALSIARLHSCLCGGELTCAYSGR
ncbi:hypothetical protein FN846DRAFT_442860 [Sphaerosporella brunnea]|uniref:Uncharacterized protein n=1 Tax=Sphaerosporella brunnea TaxID=1250544 RepID=A0A5J5EGE6_9PEZI|nr:hypothetical protein FN846DRAFT_442860 [Sphaerosporella brunnea]